MAKTKKTKETVNETTVTTGTIQDKADAKNTSKPEIEQDEYIGIRLRHLRSIMAANIACLLRISVSDNSGSSPLIQKNAHVKPAVDSLILSRCWLGTALGEASDKNPYRDTYKAIKEIVPVTDTASIVMIADMEREAGQSSLEVLQFFRKEVKALSDDVYELINVLGRSEAGISPAKEAFINLKAAGYQLGFAISSLRNPDFYTSFIHTEEPVMWGTTSVKPLEEPEAGDQMEPEVSE
jgi:hypothetical protein